MTAVFTLATVGGGMVLGLLLAVLLNRRLRFRGAARTIVVAPYVLSGVAVGLLWLFVFDPNFGALSALLGMVGIGSPDWYTDPRWALAMVVIVYLWKNVGYVALIYLAGLQAVPRDLLEAASLDGASPVRSFVSVVLPLLGPTTFFPGITTLLTSLQSFDIIRAMTNGGPLEGTTTMMYQIYLEGFAAGRAGCSSAIATILFLVLFAIARARQLRRSDADRAVPAVLLLARRVRAAGAAADRAHPELHADRRPRVAEQLPGAHPAGPGQRVRHVPVPPALPDAAAFDPGGRRDRRGRALAAAVAVRRTAVRAHHRGRTGAVRGRHRLPAAGPGRRGVPDRWHRRRDSLGPVAGAAAGRPGCS
ncbi:MAG TPA: sugar ABC transporter permease [Pseudonocardia sp.]|nr:sugar ABC transporter permease [Pseudonocardia sp.]